MFESLKLCFIKWKIFLTLQGNNQKSPDTILISITAQGQEVKKKVAEHYGIDESCLKLITCGRVIEDQKSIQEQNIRVSKLRGFLVCPGIEEEIIAEQITYFNLHIIGHIL